jgi:hypothetical protein
MIYLRQSTASQTRVLGPFLDSVDFVTPKTALTIANTDVKLMKNGAASVNKNSGGGTHRVNGEYSFTFDATDTNTVGELLVSIVVATALIVRKEITVLTGTVYDAVFGSSAAGFGVAQSGDSYTRLGAPAGASHAADVAAVKSDTAAIGAKTANLPPDPADASDIVASFAAVSAKLPASLSGNGHIKASIESLQDNITAASKLTRAVSGNVLVTIGNGSTITSLVSSSLSPAVIDADQFKGRLIVFDANTTTAALRGQMDRISAITSGGVMTVTGLTAAPVNGDTATIL